MNMNDEKMQKLTNIARLYYEEYKTQNEIAALYNISRPLVSRMLKEARKWGIVHIEIRYPLDNKEILLHHAQRLLHIKNAIVIEQGANDTITNIALAKETIEYLRQTDIGRFGIGWGTIIGVLMSCIEKSPPEKWQIKSVCPLVGNSGVSNRNYHTNENVRIISQHTGACPYYLYTPAFAQTNEELELIKKLENYKQVLKQWQSIDTALVNIGNYPSVPDFASGARYGNLLSKKKAVGRILAYYYDIEGNIICSDTDYAIQMPLEYSLKCKNVIGICSANVTAKSLLGAMNTGFFNQIICTKELLRETVQMAEP